jgi:predicted transcriptional regulator
MALMLPYYCCMKSTARKRNFHIPLPDETYQELRKAAEASKRPATQLVRDAIEHWLHQQRKNALQREIETYAQEHAGGRFDLDPDLEASGVDCLIQEGRRSR